MAKQPGRGQKRRAAALERKATQHQDFVGGAEKERAEAEFRKLDRQQEEESRETVREMANELRELANQAPSDGAFGAELPFRIPRSVEEAKTVVREAPDALREKARERLEQLPEPAQRLIQVARSAANVLLAPARIGLHLAREVLRIPFTVVDVLRHREA